MGSHPGCEQSNDRSPGLKAVNVGGAGVGDKVLRGVGPLWSRQAVTATWESLVCQQQIHCPCQRAGQPKEGSIPALTAGTPT